MDREFCVFLPPLFYIVFLPFLFPTLTINLLVNFVLQPWMNVHCHSLQIHLLYQMYQPFNPNVILLSWNGEGDSDLGDRRVFWWWRNSRFRFPEFNQFIQHTDVKNVHLTKGLVFASHAVFKEALKEWCIRKV